MPIQQLVSQIKVSSRFQIRLRTLTRSFQRCLMDGRTVLTDILVLLHPQRLYRALRRKRTVYSVFPSSTLTYTIQKLLASTHFYFVCVDPVCKYPRAS
jgi:hypothetical protein